MPFGEQLRELRRRRGYDLRTLAAKVSVHHTYLSKLENEKLTYASDSLILKLAKTLGADPDELLLLAKRIPEGIRARVLQRPDAFRRIASLNDAALDSLLHDLDMRDMTQDAE